MNNNKIVQLIITIFHFHIVLTLNHQLNKFKIIPNLAEYVGFAMKDKLEVQKMEIEQNSISKISP
jgi:hypothetical protein